MSTLGNCTLNNPGCLLELPIADLFLLFMLGGMAVVLLGVGLMICAAATDMFKGKLF